MSQDEAVAQVRSMLGRNLPGLYEIRGALATNEGTYIVYSVGGWLVAVSSRGHHNDHGKWDVRPARATLKTPAYELMEAL